MEIKDIREESKIEEQKRWNKKMGKEKQLPTTIKTRKKIDEGERKMEKQEKLNKKKI